LNRSGSMIVIFTLIFLAIIISTQFSFGRFFGVIIAIVKSGAVHGIDALRDWREERRRQKQRREVIAKHTRKDGRPPADAAIVKPEIKAPALAKPPSRAAEAQGEIDAAPQGLFARLKARKRRAEEANPPAPIAAATSNSPKSFAASKPPKLNVPAPP